jgi:hypothetical protein
MLVQKTHMYALSNGDRTTQQAEIQTYQTERAECREVPKKQRAEPGNFASAER